MFTHRSYWAGWLLAPMLIWWGLSASAAMGQDSPSNPRYSAWAAKIGDLLTLDNAQRAAFGRYLSGLPQQPLPADPQLADRFRAMTAPQRLDYMADGLERDLTKVRTQSRAMHEFYDLLSAEQRKLFDDTILPPAPHLGVAANAVSPPAPEAPNYRLPSHTEADWMIKPNGEDLARVYPAAALKAKVSGKVVLHCVADEDGYLAQCVVQEETPPGYGFGNAALEISGYMRMTPASNYGVPIRSDVNVPINFKLPR